MKFNYEKVADYCSEMTKIKNDMKKQLDSIEGIINTINSNWTGPASDNYLKKIKKISNNFDEFYRELGACVLYIQKCSDSYEKLDKQVKQEIDDILSTSKIFS